MGKPDKDRLVQVAAVVLAALVIALGMARGLRSPAAMSGQDQQQLDTGWQDDGGAADGDEGEGSGQDLAGVGQDQDGGQEQDLSDPGQGAGEADDGGTSPDDGALQPEEPSRPIPDQFSRLFESGQASTTAVTEEDFSHVAAAVGEYLDENAAATGEPGLAVGVVDAAGRTSFGTYGDCADVHDAFLIGSLSKSFTALSIMQLAEAGRLELDAPVSAYVPDYGTPASVTVRSLLNQTSGFGYYDSLADAAPGPTQGSFSYANANYDLLGKVVERVSGQPYADYLEEHVLLPLGMYDTSASMEARSEALGQRNYFGMNVADGFVHEDSDDAWGSASSGYVSSSVADMARYLAMYLDLGLEPDGGPRQGARVLSEQGIRQMFFSRVPDPGGDTFYGMGWTSYYLDDGELVLSHDGQVENGIARMCLLPERGIALIIQADSSDYYGGNGAFFQLADGVVASALGGAGEPVDGGLRIFQHVQEDALLGFILLLAVLPLAYLRRWRTGLAYMPGWRVALRLAIVHVGLPALILWEPVGQGYFWRDVVTFVPDVALALVASAALLVAGGVIKAMLWARWLHARRAGMRVREKDAS